MAFQYSPRPERCAWMAHQIGSEKRKPVGLRGFDGKSRYGRVARWRGRVHLSRPWRNPAVVSPQEVNRRGAEEISVTLRLCGLSFPATAWLRVSAATLRLVSSRPGVVLHAHCAEWLTTGASGLVCS